MAPPNALLSFLCAVMAIAACQMNDRRVPAVLASGDRDTLNALKAGLADVMGVARVELGAGDPTTESTVSVLPPALGPFETASPVVPRVFDLFVDEGICFAVARDTGEAFALEGVVCQARPS